MDEHTEQGTLLVTEKRGLGRRWVRMCWGAKESRVGHERNGREIERGVVVLEVHKRGILGCRGECDGYRIEGCAEVPGVELAAPGGGRWELIAD